MKKPIPQTCFISIIFAWRMTSNRSQFFDPTWRVDPLSSCAQEIEIRGSKEKMMDVEVWEPSNHKGTAAPCMIGMHDHCQYPWGEGNQQKSMLVITILEYDRNIPRLQVSHSLTLWGWFKFHIRCTSRSICRSFCILFIDQVGKVKPVHIILISTNWRLL